MNISKVLHHCNEEYFEPNDSRLLNLTGKTALFPFNHISKSLVQSLPNKNDIVAIADTNPERIGWIVRKNPLIPIVSITDLKQFNIENLIITSEPDKYELIKLLLPHFDILKLKLYCPKFKFNPYSHDPIGRKVWSDFTTAGPHTMLGGAQLNNLIQFLKSSIPLDGDILEIGTGEGGSTFIMASLLKYLGINKKIYTMDRFTHLNYMVLSYEETTYNLRQFPNVEVLKGDKETDIKKITDGKKFCFCFFDEWGTENSLPPVINSLVPGGIVLIDNYGQAAHERGKILADQAISRLGYSAITLESGQGLVIKNR